MHTSKVRSSNRVATLATPEKKVIAMLQVLKFVPAVERPPPAAGPGFARHALRAGLLKAAGLAVHLAARLEARAPAVRVGAHRPEVLGGAVGVRFVEAVVGLAVAAYFVAGLVGIFVV